MTLDHLSKRIKKMGTSYPWSTSSNAVLVGLVSYALVGCVALVFSLWCIRQLCAQITHNHCLQSHKGYIFPSTAQTSRVHGLPGYVLLTAA